MFIQSDWCLHKRKRFGLPKRHQEFADGGETKGVRGGGQGTARRQPSTGQGEWPQKEPNLLAP